MAEDKSKNTPTLFDKDTKGVSGTKIASGVIFEDHIDNLNGKEGAEIYDEMRRSDDTCGAIYKAFINPVISANIDFEPGIAGDKESEEMAEFSRWAWFKNMSRAFKDYLWEFLSIIVYGKYVANPHTVVKEHPDRGPQWIYQDMGWISPKTIEKWILDKNNQGVLKAIEQISTPGDENFNGPIDAKSLTIAAINREGNNFDGVSIFRQAYGNYYEKKLYRKIRMAAVSRSGLGFPIVFYPPEWKEGTDQYTALINMAKNITSHKNGYMILPEGVRIEWGEIPAKLDEIDKTIKSLNLGMTQSTLTDFIMLGPDGGAYALAKDKTDFFIDPLVYLFNIWKAIVDKKNEQMMIWNFTGADKKRDKFPILTQTGIEKETGKESIDIDDKLVTMGVLDPNKSGDRDKLRKKYGYPIDLDFEEEEINTTGKDNLDISIIDEGKNIKVDKPVKKGVAKKDVKKGEVDDNIVDGDGKGEEKMTERYKELDRSPTIYETKVNYAEIDKDITTLQDDYNNNMSRGLNVMLEKWIVDITKRMKQDSGNPIKVITDTDPGTKEQLAKSVKAQTGKIVLVGKRQVADEIERGDSNKSKLSDKFQVSPEDIEKLGPGMIAWINGQAINMSRNKTNDLMRNMRSAGLDKASSFPPSKKLTDIELNTIIASSRGAGQDFIANVNNLGGNVEVNLSLNQGRKDTSRLSREVTGFLYSAVLDVVTTPACRELDGQTRKINDSASATNDPPRRFGCRSILIPITADEPQPEWTGFNVTTKAGRESSQFKLQEVCR